MAQAKISVIVPVYNVGKFLKKCLNSVVNQTYKNLEIICVYDESPDNSLEIIEEFEARDKRFNSIKRKGQKGGLALARNLGTQKATGEYIYYLDSDDWIELDFLEKMYNTIIEKNLEAVCCTNVLHVHPDGSQEPFLQRETDGFVPYSRACLMAWGWLLKKSFLDKFDQLFPNGYLHEDIWFFNVVIRSLETVYIINNTTYYHYENEDSLMGKNEGRIMRGFDSIKVHELVYDYYKKNNLTKKWSIPFFFLPKYCLNRHENKENYYLKLKDFYSKIKTDVLENEGLYSKLEIDFLNEILSSKDYNDYKKLNTSIIGALRKNVRKNLINAGAN